MAVAGTSAGIKKARTVKKKSTRDNDSDGSLINDRDIHHNTGHYLKIISEHSTSSV